MTGTDLFFERYDKENIDDEDIQFTIKGTLSELMEKGLCWAELFSFVQHEKRNVWTASDCCIVAYVASEDRPEGHDYIMEFSKQTIGGGTNNNKKVQTVQVTAPSAECTASTLHGLFQLVGHCPTKVGEEISSETTTTKLTCRCFATNPRSPLATLEPQPFKDAISASSNNTTRPIASLSFQFLFIDQETVRAIATCGVADIEFRQCTVEGLNTALALNQGPTKLTLSCAMPEFTKLGPGLVGNSSLHELDLLLHFWLQGTPLEQFTTALKANLGLRRLAVSYLDINDQDWDALCQSLHQHPTLERLELLFTEKFVDNFRRLTPERRTNRTKSVLALLQANPRIQDMVWPEFQQDETVMHDVTELLDERKREKNHKRSKSAMS
jgi:hypothetical protein